MSQKNKISQNGCGRLYYRMVLMKQNEHKKSINFVAERSPRNTLCIPAIMVLHKNYFPHNIHHMHACMYGATRYSQLRNKIYITLLKIAVIHIATFPLEFQWISTIHKINWALALQYYQDPIQERSGQRP